MQTICSLNDLKPDIIQRIDELYPTLIDADFEGFDVRKTTNQLIESKEEFENQTKVSFEVLKKRIVGFDSNEEPIYLAEEPVEPAKKERSEDSIKKSLKNFKVEAYKSKLKELLCSKSTDSNPESQDNDSQTPDNDNEGIYSRKQDSIHSNGANEVVATELAKEESRSTNYEEVDEYQKSLNNSNSSYTEGPEYEDCVEQIHEKQDSQQIYDNFAQTDTERKHFERNNARRFISSLKLFLPKLLSLRTSVEADQALQLFASNYCTGISFVNWIAVKF